MPKRYVEQEKPTPEQLARIKQILEEAHAKDLLKQIDAESEEPFLEDVKGILQQIGETLQLMLTDPIHNVHWRLELFNEKTNDGRVKVAWVFEKILPEDD